MTFALTHFFHAHTHAHAASLTISPCTHAGLLKATTKAVLLRHPATGLLLSGSYGGANSDIAQCQSSNTLNLEAKGILGIAVQCLMVSLIDDTGSFITNFKGGGANFTFELLEQSEVGQGQGWPALKVAAIAAYNARSGCGGAVGGGGGGGAAGGGGGGH